MRSIAEWSAWGNTLATPDGRVFYVRRDPPSAGTSGGATAALLLHGFPTSSFDFAGIIDELARARTVLTLDFLGHGLSDKPARFGYSLFEQADLVTAVVRAQGLERVHVVAHDMGTSVTTELLARRERGLLPFEIASVTLMNGSVHIELSQLTFGQRLLRTPLGPAFARLSTRRTFAMQLERVLAKPPSDAELDAMWELLSRDGGLARLPQMIGYVAERWRFSRRWIGALERLDVPALVAWGRKDPVAVVEIADRLTREIPNAERVTWDDLGHYPQVEDPARVAGTIGAFLARCDERAATPAVRTRR